MSILAPKRFKVIKQGELDCFCGLYCLAMLLWNFAGDESPQLGRWVDWHRHSGMRGFSTRKLTELCRGDRKLRTLGMDRVTDGDLARYEYGIAMIATAFAGSDKRHTHYVVFFHCRGRIYIADPHPERSRKAQLLEKTSFLEDWNIEKKSAQLAYGQDRYWPGPGWAIGRRFPNRLK